MKAILRILKEKTFHQRTSLITSLGYEKRVSHSNTAYFQLEAFVIISRYPVSRNCFCPSIFKNYNIKVATLGDRKISLEENNFSEILGEVLCCCIDLSFAFSLGFSSKMSPAFGPL